ncbi:MAG: DUF4258 domain-containing protein [Bacteroidetes bacterium]|nr:DUF4258 domain-containing protein [Bacteroidota bacterium]
MKWKKALPAILLLVLLILAVLLRSRDTSTETKQVTASHGLNRNPAHITYSKHAKCRMSCRHIDESEVLEILHQGKINYAKSDLKGDDCHKKYAVEGTTHDHQHVRIIFAPCTAEMTVVTVIDLGKEWSCDCD